MPSAFIVVTDVQLPPQQLFDRVLAEHDGDNPPWPTLTLILTECRPARRFTFRQIDGPFVHERFFINRQGGTRMIDRITVGSPVLGFLVERALLVPHLRRLVRSRNAEILHDIGVLVG